MGSLNFVVAVAFGLSLVTLIGLVNEHGTLRRLKEGRQPWRYSFLISLACFVVALGGIAWHVYESEELLLERERLYQQMVELEQRLQRKRSESEVETDVTSD